MGNFGRFAWNLDRALCEEAVLDEAAPIQQKVDTLAAGKLSPRVLPFDRLFAAHSERPASGRFQLVDQPQMFVAHRRLRAPTRRKPFRSSC